MRFPNRLSGPHGPQESKPQAGLTHIHPGLGLLLQDSLEELVEQSGCLDEVKKEDTEQRDLPAQGEVLKCYFKSCMNCTWSPWSPKRRSRQLEGQSIIPGMVTSEAEISGNMF